MEASSVLGQECLGHFVLDIQRGALRSLASSVAILNAKTNVVTLSAAID